MRAPLDKIELVEKYLAGKLTAVEQLNFIKALETDVELQPLINLQRDIIRAVRRKALRAEIKTTIKHINVWKRLWKWIIGGSVLGAIIISGVMILHQEPQLIKSKPDNNLPVVSSLKERIVITDSTTHPDERIDFNGLKTWINPDVQTFKVNPIKGATIEGKEGTLIIVPSNAFVDEQNKVITTEVEFKLVEALKLEDMVLYNLGTTSNGKALGTGGMLHFDFTASGKKIKVDSKRPLYVEVPANKVKAGMMVFKGEIKNGKVNWVNPKPLKKYLVNVDFKLLDFLPTGFEDTVKSLLPFFKGYKGISSALTDSLYYSLDFICGTPRGIRQLDLDPTHREKRGASLAVAQVKDLIPVGNKRKNDSSRTVISSSSSCCGIDPLAIKTLKTAPFTKTFIATQEFAARMKELHKLYLGNELLKIYVNNLRGTLSHADSLVAAALAGEGKAVFNGFAKQGLTNIKDAAIYQDQLTAYYLKKKQEYREEQEIWRTTLANKSKGELNQLLIGWPSRKIVTGLATPNVATGAAYAFRWASPGWVNIDCYLHLLDSESKEVKMNLNAIEGTTEVYQWINFVGNLTPLVINGTEAKALFPARDRSGANIMKNTFCCAISRKDGMYKWFDLHYNPYETKVITIDLKPSTIDDIRNKLKSYDVNRDLKERLDQIEKEVAEELRYKKKTKIQMNEIDNVNAIRTRLKSVAYPCYKKESKKDVKLDSVYQKKIS